MLRNEKMYKIIERSKKEDKIYSISFNKEQAEKQVKNLNDMQIQFARLADQLEPDKYYFIEPPVEDELVLDI